MAKKELVAYVAEAANLSKKEAVAAIDAVCAGITEALKTNGRIQLTGLGSFEVKERAARSGRNPATGEMIDIPASKSATFKAGKALKDAIK